ncbi:MAG: DUF2934 domain-containing protein [Azospirillaceae bacterium]
MPIPEPSEEAIRARARAIWEAAGRPEGFAIDHWLQARWELIGELGAAGVATAEGDGQRPRTPPT